jgi:hypothetical protein
MTRRSILSISAMTALGLALLSVNVVAQQGTLRQQLVGTWTPVSVTVPVVVQLVGTDPKGILVLDAGGRYVEMMEKSDRPKSASRSEGIDANFGTWSVNDADKTLTVHRDGALSPNIEGTDQKVSVTIAGDEMRFSNGDVWRRAR